MVGHAADRVRYEDSRPVARAVEKIVRKRYIVDDVSKEPFPLDFEPVVEVRIVGDG